MQCPSFLSADEVLRMGKILASMDGRLPAMLGPLLNGEMLGDSTIQFRLETVMGKLPEGVRERYYLADMSLYSCMTGDGGGSSAAVPRGGNRKKSKVDHDSDVVDSDVVEATEVQPKKKPKNNAASRYERVKKWIKDDIFGRRYVLVPVYRCSHFTLVIICMPDLAGTRKPLMLHFDSMSGGSHKTGSICRYLLEFLRFLWDDLAASKDDSSFPSEWVKKHPEQDGPWHSVKNAMDIAVNVASAVGLPQQDNTIDCGLFMCMNAEFFCHADPELVSMTKQLKFEGMRLDHVTSIGPGWYHKEEVSMLRVSIGHQLVLAEQSRMKNPITEIETDAPASARRTRSGLAAKGVKVKLDFKQLVLEATKYLDQPPMPFGTRFMPVAEYMQLNGDIEQDVKERKRKRGCR